MSVMGKSRRSIILVVASISIILLQSWTPLAVVIDNEKSLSAAPKATSIWTGSDQPWSQFGHNPTRNSTSPIHSTTGGFGKPSLGIITDPSINWKSTDDANYGVQSYGSVVGDFSGQISSSVNSNERCGSGNLFAVFTIERDVNSENDWLVIVEGGLNKEAWRVDLGDTSDVKSTPAIVDVDKDGIFEIILAYDTTSGLTVDVWSPLLSCSEAGTWNADQHSNELMWTYTIPDLNLGINADSFNAGHLASTQALVADLELDGSPELILSTVDEISERPTIVAIPLLNSAPSQPLWQIQLDFGTHPSDPTWAQIDEDNAAIFVTTIDSDDGNMWAWRINSETGSLDWNARSLINEGDSGVPHIRLPGPVIAQLDSDSLPEVIFTAPGDWDGESAVDAASYHAWEVTDGSEIWSFKASNGYAETPPLPLDIDSDGIHEFLCWATWFENGVFNSDRHGRVGCEDFTGDTSGWWKDIEPLDGNSNDGIALSQPISLNIDGIGAPDIILAYGQSLRAFDGDTGDSNIWEDDIDIGKRTWASPALADLDGDGLVDILIGDVLVSQSSIDIAPILDGRGITFSPSLVDPGDLVEITAQYANHGTVESDEPVDAKMYVNNQLIASKMINNMEAGAPSGNAIDSSFTAQWTASLGTHEIRLELDPNNNLTQSRTDNDNFTTQFTVLEPYNLAISLPSTNRINPGEEKKLDLEIFATGRRSAEWSMSLNTSSMPENWIVTDNDSVTNSVMINPNDDAWKPDIHVSIPEDAQGSESGFFQIIMTLDSNSDIVKIFNIPIEVNRTRGLSITGPDGNAFSTGNGLRGSNASAWFQIENLGNARERLTSQTWSSNIWQTTPLIFDELGGPYYSITLEPGEIKEFVAKVQVPTNIDIGSMAENKFTACIGSEENTLCKSIDFTFFSNSISITPPHINSIPGVELSWELNSNSSDDDLIIDFASAGMLQPGWIWSAEGHGEILNNVLEIKQSSGNKMTWLNATIPSQSPPLLHSINSGIDGLTSINFTVNILQVNRAEIQIVEPNEEPVIVEVNDLNSLVVKLTNKGNGDDTFKLNAEFVDIGDIKTDPGIQFNILQSTFTLGVDSSVFPTIDYSISENSPAGQSIALRISITSTIDPTLYEFSDIIITAKQNHNWVISNISELENYANPYEMVNFTFNVTNSGNLADTMEWLSTIESSQHENDSSEWDVIIENEREVEVNETTKFQIQIVVPQSSWEGSILYYNLSLISDSRSYGEINFTVITLRNSGWEVKSTNDNLDIDASGSNISFRVENKGNAIVEPIIIPVVPSGWNLTNISIVESVEPSDSIIFTVEIRPPLELTAGDIGLMTLIVKDGDTLEGRSEISVPLRIAPEFSYEIGYDENWIVSSDGGYPLAWIENTGNSLNKINVELDLLEGWEIESPLEFYVPSGVTLGIPISIIPPTAWNGDNFTQKITVNDESGNSEELFFNVKKFCCNLDVSWGTSPIFSGHINHDVFTKTIGEDERNHTINLIESGIFNLEYCELNSLLDCENELKYKVIIQEKSKIVAKCEFDNSNLSEIERNGIINSEKILDCIFEENYDPIKWTLVMRINGALVDRLTGKHLGNLSKQSLTLEKWEAISGINLIEIEIYDEFGVEIERINRELVIPYKNWNIGISSVDFSSENNEIIVNMRRENFEKLEDVHCFLIASAEIDTGSWESSWKIDMSQGKIAPTHSISLPNITSESIALILSCERPWDLDDDIEDNSFTFTLPNVESPIIKNSNWVWGLSTLIIILLVAKILGFLEIKPRNNPARNKKIINSSDNEKMEIKFINENDEESESEIFLDSEEIPNIESGIKLTDNEIQNEKELNEIVSENSKENIEEITEIKDDKEINSEKEKMQEDIDAKIDRMMSRKRYY